MDVRGECTREKRERKREQKQTNKQKEEKKNKTNKQMGNKIEILTHSVTVSPSSSSSE